jgi:hypothetical protein
LDTGTIPVLFAQLPVERVLPLFIYRNALVALGHFVYMAATLLTGVGSGGASTAAGGTAVAAVWSLPHALSRLARLTAIHLALAALSTFLLVFLVVATRDVSAYLLDFETRFRRCSKNGNRARAQSPTKSAAATTAARTSAARRASITNSGAVGTGGGGGLGALGSRAVCAVEAAAFRLARFQREAMFPARKVSLSITHVYASAASTMGVFLVNMVTSLVDTGKADW